jgi:hypothetical protein
MSRAEIAQRIKTLAKIQTAMSSVDNPNEYFRQCSSIDFATRVNNEMNRLHDLFKRTPIILVTTRSGLQ